MCTIRLYLDDDSRLDDFDERWMAWYSGELIMVLMAMVMLV